MQVTQIIQWWSQIRGGLLATVDKFTDEDLAYTPVEKGYAVGQIMLHVAHEEYGEIQYGLTRAIPGFPPPFPDQEYPTVGSIKDLLASVHEETVTYLNGLAVESNYQSGTRNRMVRWASPKPRRPRSSVATSPSSTPAGKPTRSGYSPATTPWPRHSRHTRRPRAP
jgi:hypothetical protein